VLHSLARKERSHNHWHLGIVIRDARVVRSLSHEPARLTVESHPGPTYLQRPTEGSFGPSIPANDQESQYRPVVSVVAAPNSLPGEH
jgi:hypothetical protein